MAKYYKTDVPCDGVEILFDQGYAEENFVAAGTINLTQFAYITGTDNIQVFIDDALLDSSLYTEDSSTQITIDPTVTGAVKVIRKPGKLVEGVHYDRINSQVIEFIGDGIIAVTSGGSPAVSTITKIYTRNPAKSKLNPAKIIDTKAGVVTADVPVWDPARGHHFHNAIHVIDLQSGDPLTSTDEDPALYNMVINEGEKSEQAWNSMEVGTIWFDKSTLGYLPYYDEKVYPNIDDRLFNWGKLAPWASVNFYEWTESAVLPGEYDAIAAVQEGDATIDEKERVTGRVKGIPYKRTRNNFNFTTTAKTTGTQTVPLDPTVYGITNENDFTGLVNNFSQQFAATVDTTGSPTTTEQFTLLNSYVPNQGLIFVTINGLPASPSPTETSTTTFELTGASVGDVIIATVTAPNYSTEITVDGGTAQLVVINGSVAQNFGQLISRINTDITGAIASLNGNEIVITSDTTGGTSTISINDNANPIAGFRLFQNIVNIGSGSPLAFTIETSNGVDSEVVTTGHTFVDGDSVIISTDGTLPTPLEAGGTYTISATGSPIGNSFNIKDSSNMIVEFVDSGTGTHTIAESSFPTLWTKEIDIHEVIDAVYKELQDTSNPITVTKFGDGDSVDVYINEVFQETVTVTTSTVTLTSYVFQSRDTIRVIRSAHDIVAADEGFDPDTSDDGTIHVQYKNLYNYTEVTTIAENGIDEVKKYYYWVGDKSVRTITNSALSLREAQQQLEEIPTPYIIFQNLKTQEFITIDLPSRYNQIILRGHSGLISADDRYVLRFTRDMTLRDTIDSRENEPMLKNVHTEWELFREKQQSHPRRDLWDKITESIVGYRLDDVTKRIPSRERELYDETYNTDTRYGLGEGQIFVDGNIATATVLADLNNPDNDFYPTDIDVFLQLYNFDTPENSILLMDRLYNTFSYEHVNRILHSVMLDAFSKKDKYPDIFKTSMISLHGIRILETAGLYDS
jgi:hypothetical protein